MYKILMVGPPGAGKDLQSKMLSAKLLVPHISTGEMLRSKGITCADGKLFPDEEMNNLVKERLGSADCKWGYVLDGYPRNIEQAQFLDSYAKIERVLNLDTIDLALKERMLMRRHCGKCGGKYGLAHMPKVENMCDECRIPLERRKDDNLEVFGERLKIYRKKTEPIIGYYMGKGKLITINGEQSPEDVFAEILRKL